MKKILSFLWHTSLLLIRVIHYIIRFFPVEERSEILILALKRIGDTVFLLPALKSFVNLNASKRIIILCTDVNYYILQRYIKGVEYIILPRKEMVLKLSVPKPGFLKRVRAGKRNTIIDVTSDYTSVPFLVGNRTSKIYGANKPEYRFLYTNFIPIRTVKYLQDIYYDVFCAYDYRITREYEGLSRPQRKIQVIGINPHAGWGAKEWGLKKYVQLSELLRSNYIVNWIIEPCSIRGTIIDELREMGVQIYEPTTIESLVSVFTDVDLFIGNDSGPVHLAALEGVPTFAIFGPTNPDFIRQHGDHYQTLQKRLPCSPISTQYCELDAGVKCPTIECMATLMVDEVYRSLMHFINKLDQTCNEE